MATGRAISEEFLLDFCNNGDLSYVIDYIKEHKELNLCFRGNSGNRHGQIMIYKNNHLVSRISKYIPKNKPKFKMEFNFNHARYCKDWEKYLVELNKLGWCSKSFDQSMQEFDIGYIHYAIDDVDNYKIKRSLDIFCEIIEDFFDLGLDYDYFKDSSATKDDLREKKAQHELQATNSISDTEAEYLVYDLEFTEKGKKKGNKPDFFALKCVNGIVKGLVIGEVKSTKGSFGGGSGLIKHLDGMCEQIQTFNTNNIRMLEAAKILRDYAKLNLKGLKQDDIKKFSDEFFVNLKFIEVLVVLTEGAIDEYDNISGRGKVTYRNILKQNYDSKYVVVKKFVNGKLEDI